VNEPIGHQAVRERLTADRAGGRWASAYVFAGPQGVGKRRVAEWFLQSFACTGAEPRPCGNCAACRQWAGGNYPDYHVLGVRELVNIPAPHQDEAQEEIATARIEMLRGELARKPLYAAGHLVIIDEAERLNPFSGNALLKTLEEPNSRPVIVLVTSRFHRMLATIRSRSRMVRFGRLTEAESQQVVAAQGIDPTALDVALAAGSAGRLAVLTASNRAAARQNLLRHLATGEPGWWDMAPAFGLNKKDEPARMRRAAREALETLLYWRRQVLRTRQGGAVPPLLAECSAALAADGCTAEELETRTLAVLDWLQRLDKYTNAGAALDGALAETGN